MSAKTRYQLRPKLEVQYHPGVGGGGTDEILRPTLMCVSNGSCFRLVRESFGKRDSQEFEPVEDVHTTAYRNPPLQEDVYDEGEDSLAELEGMERSSSGGFVLSLPIPSVFFRYIIGVGGATLKNIQTDTKCHIAIPRRGQEGDIVIEGKTAAQVAHAKRRVEMVAWTNRFKEEPTHFLSIPLTAPGVKEKVREFKERVLLTCGKDVGVVKEAFKEPEKLHLTLGVLRIFSREDEAKAVKTLQKVVADAKNKLGSETVTIKLQGLNIMGDDRSAARIIYAEVKSSERLQDFVDDICGRFIKEAPELMRREFEREGVKLHATVMNSKFLEQKRGGGQLEVHKGMKRYKPTISINATELLKVFGDFRFGEMPLSCVQLSKRFEVEDSGYYKCVCNQNI